MWAVDGIPIVSGGTDQAQPQLASDGQGGAVVSWEEHTFGVSRAQRVDPTGALLWAAQGVQVGSAVHRQMAGDGAGGAVIALTLGGCCVTAQKVAADGTLPWGGGVLVIGDGNVESPAQITVDGTGGAVVTWADDRNSGQTDVFAQRIDSQGTALWTANGLAISTTNLIESRPVIVKSVGAAVLIAFESLKFYPQWGYRSDVWVKLVSADGTLGAVPSSTGARGNAFTLSTCNPCTQRNLTFAYTLSEPAFARVSVHDVAGRRRFDSTFWAAAGWNSGSLAAHDWPAGVYLVSVEAAGVLRSTKAVVVR